MPVRDGQLVAWSGGAQPRGARPFVDLARGVEGTLDVDLGDVGAVGADGLRITVAMIWLPGPLELGLEPVQTVLLVMTVAVTAFTMAQGQTYALHGILHLTLLVCFLFLSIQP